MLTDLKAVQFMEKFKQELSSLDKQVSEVIKSMIDSDTATSWPNL
jgi:hypothetical protein